MDNFIPNDHIETDFNQGEVTAPPFWLPLADRKLFCSFDTIYDAEKQKFIKHPYATSGKKGIKKLEAYLLDTYSNAAQFIQSKTGAWKLGFGFLEPIEVDGKYLICVDIDIDANASDDAIERTKQIKRALMKTGAYYEQSVSGRGSHFFLLCDEENIPPTYKNDEWMVEVFSGFKDQSKLVCLTGDGASGNLVEVNLSLLFTQQGIGPIKEPTLAKATTINMDARRVMNGAHIGSLNSPKADLNDVKRAIQYIPNDNYDDWIKVGMALSSEFGDAGFSTWDYWSSSSAKYQPDEMHSKWNSFTGNGTGIGTLFMLANSNGYKQIHVKESAANEFGPYVVDEDGVITGEILKPTQRSILDRQHIPHENLQPIDWVIDDLIPAGVGSIPGYSGIGKTTCLIPLAVAVAGFASHMDNINVSVRRKVVIFTEDTSQIDRSLHGILAYLKLKNIKHSKDSVIYSDLIEWVKVFNSRRLSLYELEQDVLEAIALYKTEHEVLGEIAPLIVFDTAAANLRVEEENNNSEISTNVSKLKELHETHKAHFWIINHFSKEAKGKSIDELLHMSARGGSAWGSDAHWDCVMGKSDKKDDAFTVLKIGKERTGKLQGKEIHFSIVQHAKFVETQLKTSQEVFYPVVSIQVSSTGGRVKEASQEAAKAKIEEIAEILANPTEPDGYVNKTELLKRMVGNNDNNRSIIKSLENQGVLLTIDIPKDLRVNKNRKQAYQLVQV